MGLIHPYAVVHAGATLGQNTKVWQGASVIREAIVGDDCTIGSCAVVDGAIVGDRCLIGHGAQVHPGTKLGDDVFVGPGAIICNDMWPSTSKQGFEIDQRHTVVIEDGAIIGAGAIILPGVRIGAGSMVAAGMVCEESLPPGVLIQRNGYLTSMPENRKRMRYAP